MFDILIQNNASKEIFILPQMENMSENNLYLQFDNVNFPSGVVDGEYTYAVIYNDRDDVVYETNIVLMKTVLKTGEGDFVLGDLKPLTGLLRVGEVQDSNTYKKDENKTIYYYKK